MNIRLEKWPGMILAAFLKDGGPNIAMHIYRFLVFFILFITLLSGCARKSHPATGTSTSSEKPESKPARPRTVKTAIPKVIVVNDQVAKRSVDGRYYYDLEGRRYWRNNRDGKYYLYYKGIFDNPDFKAPGN